MNIAYIDCQNIHKGVQNQWREIDWKKFFVYLRETVKVNKVKFFIGYIESNTKFYDTLKEIWYIVVFKTTSSHSVQSKTVGKKERTTIIKGNIDSELVVEAMRDFYENWMKIWHLVSGDGDFTVLVNFWNEKEVLGNVFVPLANRASVLLKLAAWKKIIEIKGLKPKIFRQ